MADVLAIEPNAEQRSILQEILREHADAKVLVVESKDSAIAAIQRQTPDLVLVSALLSPRDESEIVDCIKALPNATHLQTLTIPLLRSNQPKQAQAQGRFSIFRKRRQTAGTEGCDPRKFAEEVSEYLGHAAVLRRVGVASMQAQDPPEAHEMATAELDDLTTQETTAVVD